LLAQRGFSVGVVNPRFIKPLDGDLLRAQSKFASAFVTIENGVVNGGFGSAVEEGLNEIGFAGRVLRYGWPNEFIPHGARALLMEKYGLTPTALAHGVAEAMNR
jgi:1-deoxy-D-xylulose-5-phosphate synthase